MSSLENTPYQRVSTSKFINRSLCVYIQMPTHVDAVMRVWLCVYVFA